MPRQSKLILVLLALTLVHCDIVRTTTTAVPSKCCKKCSEYNVGFNPIYSEVFKKMVIGSVNTGMTDLSPLFKQLTKMPKDFTF